MSAATVRVGRLRVEDVRRDPLATRVALDRALAGASLAPRALPPSAILVVRALRDPLPRRLALDAAWRAPPEWEDAVSRTLDELARSAARPALGPVPAGATAVCFADRAELLACLARDWASGLVAGRWWWRLLVRGDPSVSVPAELRAWPAYVPAAFELLAARGEAVAVAAALPADEARALAESVAATFGAPAALVAAHRPAVEAPVVADVEDETPAARAPGRRGREPDAAAPAARAAAAAAAIEAAVPEARAAGLLPAQRRLLALVLGLRRAPAPIRAAGAVASDRPAHAEPAAPPLRERAPAARVRPRATSSVPAPPAAAPPAPAPSRPRRRPRRADAEPPQHLHEAEAPPPAPPDEAPAPAAPPDTRRPPAPRPAGRASQPPQPAERVEPEPATQAGPPPAPAPEARETPPPPRAPAGRASRRHAAAPPHAPLPEPPWPRSFGPAVSTQLGGLFYLVNAAIDLGLYGDFTQPARPGIELAPWDFLALAGRELLGDGDDDDPVWTLLAELAGRDPEDKPGAGFAPATGETVGAWTARVADEVRALLAAADLTPPRLLRRAALVHVGEAHVDVVFALAGHPLEIRVAGLDRDPGFVPAAGLHVAFHYE